MTNNLHSPFKDQSAKHDCLVEVSNKEKQLWVLIHTKGLLQTDVKDLYRKVRSTYEKIILDNYDQTELQDVEYSLWKLHYKHIDEFRKRIKKSSTAEPYETKHIVGFKLFLSEAIEFYQNLIVKTRKAFRFPEESSFYGKGGNFGFSEPKKMQKCQFLCHRFLVCLGDLARYREHYEKPDIQNHNWSMAATHYMEATVIWPDSGNPHNQLAVLATYVGDEFLALYHCIRSLAVKEPFPDARDNLILLLERNRSSCLQSLSCDDHFNFLKPSERRITKKNSKNEDNGSIPAKFWSLFIRIMSFFFVKSSLNEFPSAFTASVTELDALMALDDTELKASLESYRHMDSVKTGPFRAIQVVSILLYTLQNLIKSPQIKVFEDLNDTQLIVVRQLALTATFIFMGRFVDRCLNARALNSCPLLPAVLVFVEWLATMLNEVEHCEHDEKTSTGMSYFFGSLLDLLKRFDVNKNGGNSSDSSPLWEDYELRGFAPVASGHESLDFSSQWVNIDNFENGTESRIYRIINAALKIANRSNDSQKWIIYDEYGGKFHNLLVAESNEFPDKRDSEKAEPISCDPKTDMANEFFNEYVEESEKQFRGEDQSVNGRSVAVEDEEVILFKPLTRYNSAPLCSNSNNPTTPKETEDPTVPADDCLRRATSLLITQNQAQGNPSSVQADISNFRHNDPFELQELFFKDAGVQPFPDSPISAGPPSLSAWVLDRGSSNNKKEKSSNGVSKRVLSPIQEVASESLYSLSAIENEDTTKTHSFSTTPYSSSPYSAPVPSAPLLPDDAAWFKGLQSSFDSCKVSESLNRTETISNASEMSGSYPTWTATQGSTDCGLSSIPGLTGSFPPQRRMTSSEWLRQYRENRNLERGGYNHTSPSPSYFYSPGNLGNSYIDYNASRSDLLDQWGYPLASNPTMQAESPALYPAFPLDHGAADLQRREKLLYGYQRPSPYVCGAVTDMRNEPQPLLQYLKEKERQLQRDPTVMRGPTYMGN